MAKHLRIAAIFIGSLDGVSLSDTVSVFGKMSFALGFISGDAASSLVLPEPTMDKVANVVDKLIFALLECLTFMREEIKPVA